MKLAVLKTPMEFKSGEGFVTKAAGETVKVKEVGQFTAACLAEVDGVDVLFFCRPEDITLGTGEYMKEGDTYFRKLEDGFLRVFTCKGMASIFTVNSIPFAAVETTKEDWEEHVKKYKKEAAMLNKLNVL